MSEDDETLDALARLIRNRKPPPELPWSGILLPTDCSVFHDLPIFFHIVWEPAPGNYKAIPLQQRIEGDTVIYDAVQMNLSEANYRYAIHIMKRLGFKTRNVLHVHSLQRPQPPPRKQLPPSFEPTVVERA